MITAQLLWFSPVAAQHYTAIHSQPPSGLGGRTGNETEFKEWDEVYLLTQKRKRDLKSSNAYAITHPPPTDTRQLRNSSHLLDAHCFITFWMPQGTQWPPASSKQSWPLPTPWQQQLWPEEQSWPGPGLSATTQQKHWCASNIISAGARTPTNAGDRFVILQRRIWMQTGHHFLSLFQCLAKSFSQ